jgi:hypothetical protein
MGRAHLQMGTQSFSHLLDLSTLPHPFKVSDCGKLNSVLTVFEIQHGEDTVGEG